MAESMDTITSVREMNEWAILQIPGRKTIGSCSHYGIFA